MSADASSSKDAWFRSPKRYFLDAPKEQPGTCFVKNDDYAEAIDEIQRLTAELKGVQS